MKTLERLGQLVVDRSDPIPVWFVLMSGFDADSAIAECLERPS